jgi:hypothetical protein
MATAQPEFLGPASGETSHGPQETELTRCFSLKAFSRRDPEQM